MISEAIEAGPQDLKEAVEQLVKGLGEEVIRMSKVITDDTDELALRGEVYASLIHHLDAAYNAGYSDGIDDLEEIKGKS